MNKEKMSGGGVVEEEKSSESEQINNLWLLYMFPGRPPKAGGEAERRLLDACREHTYAVLRQDAGVSDSVRRKTHDKIAMMIYGKKREQLGNYEAELLSDFACKMTIRKTVAEALKDLEKYRKQGGI